MKLEIEKIIVDHFDRKISLGEAVSKIRILFDEKQNELPIISDVEIKAKIQQKEKHHLEGMVKSYGESVPTEFAAMCCGNSFEEGAKFVQDTIKQKLTQ